MNEEDFRLLGEKIRSMIKRLRELESERERLQVEIKHLNELKAKAAERIETVIERLEQDPE